MSGEGGFDLEKLITLREKVQSQVKEEFDSPKIEHRYRVQPEKPYQFTYREGYPLKLLLTGGAPENAPAQLEIGRPADLGIELEEKDVDFIVIDRPLMELHRPGLGMVRLDDKDSVTVGRNHLEHFFRFPDTVSRNHAKIIREDVQTSNGKETYINIQDLNSSLGTSVIVSDADPQHAAS